MKQILDSFFTALQNLLESIFSILSNVKNILILTPAILLVSDLVAKGQLGFVSYMLSIVGQLVTVVKTGGWEIIIVFLLLAYLFKKE